MEYTLKSWDYDGNLIANGDGTSTQPIIIVPQIKGDTYGFVSPSSSKNQTKITIPAKIQVDMLKEYIQPLAEAFCAQQYPNK